MADHSPNQPAQIRDDKRDLFLSYNSLDIETVRAIAERLHAANLTTFLDKQNLKYGLPWMPTIEHSIDRASAVAVFISKHGFGPYQEAEVQLAIIRQVEERKNGRAFPVIPVLLPGTELENIPGFLRLNHFLDLRNEATAPDQLQSLISAICGNEASPLTETNIELCPYRGLEVFREEDAALFFGRDQFADELLQKVLSNPLIAVVGPSGSGKSSVVQAGLLPRLRREGWPNQTCVAVIFTPRENPFHSLAQELLPLIEPTKSTVEQIIEARTLADALAAGTIPLDDPIIAALKTVQTAKRLLLVVDQFEEIFTLTEERYRQAFVDTLIAAATRADSPVTVMLTLRADFYGQAIGLSRSLSDLIQQGLVNLGPMTRDELRQAIEAPAYSVGLEFERGLVERILDNIENQPGNLPLLEFALTELWGKRQGRLLTHRQYDEIGGVEGAVGQRAEQVFSTLKPGDQRLLMGAFTRLVRVSDSGEEGADTRQRISFNELEPTTHNVLQPFVKARLLVTSRNEAVNEETIEVAHEALIRRWNRLREVLDEDRKFILWRQRLGFMLSEWNQASRNDGGLLRGTLLDEAQRWNRDRRKDLNQQEMEFIRQSVLASKIGHRRALLVASLLIGILVVMGGWKAWDSSDASQINKILTQSPNLVKLTAVPGAPFDNADVSGEWLQTLVFIGKSDEAIQMAHNMDTPSAQQQALVRCIEALTRSGKVEQAKKIADEVLSLVNKIETSFPRFQALMMAVEAMEKSGRGEDAQRITDEILASTRANKNLIAKFEALIGIAEMLSKAGKNDEARKVADEVFEEMRKAEADSYNDDALRRIVGLQTGLGKIGEAVDAMQKVKSTFLRSELTLDIVRALAKSQNGNWAYEIAMKIDDPEYKNKALIIALEVLAESVNSRDVLGLVRSFKDTSQKGEVIVNVIKALLKKDDVNSAFEVYQKIEDGYSQDVAKVNLAEALARLGKISNAISLIKGISYPYLRSEALSRIAGGQIEKGKLDDASDLARKIEQGHTQSEVMLRIVKAFSKLRQMDKAKRLTYEMPQLKATNDLNKSQISVNTAKAFAVVHLYQEAREMAELSTSSSEKLSVYAAILREYHIERHPEDAKLFVKEPEEK